MQELAANNPFGFFVLRNRESIQTKRKNNIEPRISLQRNSQEYKNSGYYLDSISAFAENQSLTPEQIAKKQTESINSEIKALRSKFETLNFEEIKKFLSRNRFLIGLLEEIPDGIYQYFSDSPKLALKVSYEPEFPNSSELWIEILTKLSAKEATNLLEKFDEKWWLENMEKGNGKVNITVKFI